MTWLLEIAIEAMDKPFVEPEEFMGKFSRLSENVYSFEANFARSDRCSHSVSILD